MHANDLSNLNQEFAALATEIDRVATDTTFNNKAIIGADAGAVKITVGADEADVVTFTTKSLELSTTAVYVESLDNMMTAGTADDAETTGVIGHLDDAIKGIAAERAAYGATINRLEYAVDTLNASVLNTQAARSQIVDADYAAETTELARTQIISQASTAMLSQANQQAQSVLALLK
jgi:flagellin